MYDIEKYNPDFSDRSFLNNVEALLHAPSQKFLRQFEQEMIAISGQAGQSLFQKDLPVISDVPDSITEEALREKLREPEGTYFVTRGFRTSEFRGQPAQAVLTLLWSEAGTELNGNPSGFTAVSLGIQIIVPGSEQVFYSAAMVRRYIPHLDPNFLGVFRLLFDTSSRQLLDRNEAEDIRNFILETRPGTTGKPDRPQIDLPRQTGNTPGSE